VVGLLGWFLDGNALFLFLNTLHELLSISVLRGHNV
jgi:hypothetical protein